MKATTLAFIACSTVSAVAPPAIAANAHPSSGQADTLSDKHRTILELAAASRATASVRVAAEPIMSAQDFTSAAAKVTLNLGAGKRVAATRTSLEVTSDGEIWRGVLAAGGGQATLLRSVSGRISGTIQHAGYFYSIRPLGDNVHAVVEMADDRMPQEHPAAMLTSSSEMFEMPRGASALIPLTRGMPPASAGNQPKRRAEALPTADTTIDVLVAYTKKAARYYDDIRSEVADLAIGEANESFRRSRLGHIKLRLVHAYQTDYVEEGGFFNHLWRMADKGDGYMEEVHALREKYHADVVFLVVDDPEACGLSTRVHAEANEAFAVVHHECATTSHSLAHEIGHIIGARHELSIDTIMTPFPYGHGYVNGTKWRDIMSYKASCGGCPRLPIWSSPSVLIDGEPAGTTEQNNARVIAEEAKRVASFR